MSGVAAVAGAAWAQRLEAGRAQVRARQHCVQDLKAFESALGRAHTPHRGESHRSPTPPVHSSTADGPLSEVPTSTPLLALPLPHGSMSMHGAQAMAASGAPPSRRLAGPGLEAAPPQPPAAGLTTHAGPLDGRWQFDVADAGSPLCRITVQRLPEGGFQVALQTMPTAAGQAGTRLPLQPLRRRLAGHGAWLDTPATMEAPQE